MHALQSLGQATYVHKSCHITGQSVKCRKSLALSCYSTLASVASSVAQWRCRTD